jgi:hypothetical protein
MESSELDGIGRSKQHDRNLISQKPSTAMSTSTCTSTITSTWTLTCHVLVDGFLKLVNSRRSSLPKLSNICRLSSRAGRSPHALGASVSIFNELSVSFSPSPPHIPSLFAPLGPASRHKISPDPAPTYPHQTGSLADLASQTQHSR